MTVKLILFDIGNVLVELGDASLIQNHSRQSFTADYFWQTWPTIEAVLDFESGKTDSISFSKAVIDFYDLELTPEDFLEVFRSGVVRKFRGVDEYLSRLSNSYELACLSNTNAVHWPKIRDDFDLEKYFRKSFLSYELELLKPDPAIYRHVLEDVELKAPEILFVDDMLQNIQSAQHLGFQCCHVKNFNDAKSKLKGILKQ